MINAARFSAWLPCAVLLSLPQVVAQQKSAAPHKVLTPEQKAYQQQYQAWEANRRILQAQAKKIYNAEIAREQAGDCPNSNTQMDINVCMGELAQTTDDALAGFEQIIRGLEATQPKMPGSVESATRSSSGPTQEQILAQFDQLEQSWERYRKIACEAAYDQFYGGSGAGSFGAQCQVQLTRDHIRELRMIYGEDFL